MEEYTLDEWIEKHRGPGRQMEDMLRTVEAMEARWDAEEAEDRIAAAIRRARADRRREG